MSPMTIKIPMRPTTRYMRLFTKFIGWKTNSLFAADINVEINEVRNIGIKLNIIYLLLNQAIMLRIRPPAITEAI